MRVRSILILGGFFLGFFFSLTSANAQGDGGGQGRTVHAKYVIVNSRAITLEDIRRATRYSLNRYLKGVKVIDGKDLIFLEKQYQDLARRELIKAFLLEDEAKRKKFEIDDKRINEALRRQGEKNPEEAPSVARKLAAAEVTFDRLLAEKGRGAGSPIPPRDIRAFWKKYKGTLFRTHRLVKVRHIFLGTAPVPSRTPEVQNAKIKTIRGQLLRTPLAQRAQVFAEKAAAGDGAEGAHGGLIRFGVNRQGYFPQRRTTFQISRDRTLYPEPVIQGIRGLVTPGDISSIIASRSGVHLLYLEAAQGGEQMKFSKAQPIIGQFLQKRRRQSEMRLWLKEILKRSLVTWHDGSPFPVENIMPPEADSPDTASGSTRMAGGRR